MTAGIVSVFEFFAYLRCELTGAARRGRCHALPMMAGLAGEAHRALSLAPLVYRTRLGARFLSTSHLPQGRGVSQRARPAASFVYPRSRRQLR
jgi:hypothetical protein